MDLRIVNTCNNNCLYCLEQWLRKEWKFISKEILFQTIFKDSKRDNITFYWGNPLLHPDILEIVKFSYEHWYKWIGLLSNLFWVNKNILDDFLKNWLTTLWIYFNSFSVKNHELANWWGISYDEYLKNLDIVSKSRLNLKIIVHINKLNISTIAKDILILNKKYGIINFDFVNYFPFDRPYSNKDLLEYDVDLNRVNINLLFKVIKKIDLHVRFVKFDKIFFWGYTEYYNFEYWVLRQIWEEDMDRLNSEELPFCYKENRCSSCFIKDDCKFYGI